MWNRQLAPQNVGKSSQIIEKGGLGGVLWPFSVKKPNFLPFSCPFLGKIPKSPLKLKKVISPMGKHPWSWLTPMFPWKTPMFWRFRMFPAPWIDHFNDFWTPLKKPIFGVLDPPPKKKPKFYKKLKIFITPPKYARTTFFSGMFWLPRSRFHTLPDPYPII